MQTVDNWNVKLVKYADSVRGLPWEWGVTDCGILTRRCLEVVYGKDVWEDVGNWSSRIGALRLFGSLDDVEGRLMETGAIGIGARHLLGGDIAIGGGDHDGLPQFTVILPGFMLLGSTPEDGVIISKIKPNVFNDGTTFWTYRG